jgi:hypothetical protein
MDREERVERQDLESAVEARLQIHLGRHSSCLLGLADASLIRQQLIHSIIQM